MKATRAIVGAALAGTLAAGGGTPGTDAFGTAQAQAQGRASFQSAPNIAPPWLGTVSSKSYDGDTDDLLTGGFGKSGLALAAPPFNPPIVGTPNAAQLRRWAIHTNYRAIVDTTAGGGYGTLYGPNVAPDGTVGSGEGKIAGTEHIAYAGLGNARENVTLMVQVPASFDPAKACIVTGTSSGSRGVYGAIGSSGEWGLKRGCAVAYADKGTGMGVHNLMDDTVNLIDGTRTTADLAGDASNFTAKLVAQQRQDFNANTPNRLAVKHAHSEQNPEKDWGRDTLRAVEFALYVLNERYGETLPSGKKSRVITPGNTIVIASSVSNGGGAAIAAAEEDKFGLIDGVAVSEPNVQISRAPAPVIKRGSLTYTGGSKPLYDYFTFANLYQPCAALSPRAAGIATGAVNVVLGTARCTSLADKGLLTTATTALRAEEALDKLLGYGWEPESNVLQPSHYSFATPSITTTYSNAHGRFSVLDNLCGLSFAYTSAAFVPTTAPASLAWIFSTGNGVPPMAGGFNIVNNNSVGGPFLDSLSISPSTLRQDFNIDGALCQRELMTGGSPNAQRVQLGLRQVEKSANLQGKPAIIVHGRSDTLVPTNFTSRPYYAQNKIVEGAGSKLQYIEVTNAQHFDAFLPFPGFNERFIPLHVYFNRALDAMYAHLTQGTPLPPSQVVRTTPRGVGAPAITPANVPAISASPGANAITFSGTTLTIPD
jgi:hydroxybutyrate-dimer hydrolase